MGEVTWMSQIGVTWCNENLPESMDFHDFPMKYVDFPAFFRFHQFY